MEKKAGLFVWLLLIVAALSAQSKEEIAVRNLLNEQTNEWNNGNIAAFMETYWKSDSLMFVGKSGVTYGWQKTMDNYKEIIRIRLRWGS